MTFITLLLQFNILFFPPQPDRYEQLCYEGLDYIEQKHYHLALLCFDQAVNLRPKTDSAYIMMGVTYYFLHQPQQALKYCNIAIRINPKNAYTYYVRDMVLDSMKPYAATSQADSLRRAKQPADSILEEKAMSEYDYGTRIYDVRRCYCPGIKEMFGRYTDTIQETETAPGINQKLLAP